MRMRLNPAGDIPLGDPQAHPPKHSWDRVVYNDFIFGGDSPPPPPAPDYSALATSSTEAAQIGADLGREQLAESRRQYDINRGVSDRVANSQIALMDQSRAQGDDYYNYMKANQRPVEESLNRQSMADFTARDNVERNRFMDRYYANEADNNRERGIITGGNRGIYDARRADIEYDVGNATADARNGQTQQMGMMLRQAQRLGYSPEKMAAVAAQQGLGNASQIAGASNAARTQSIDRQRGLMSTGYDLRNAAHDKVTGGLMNDRNLRMQDDSTYWARKLDVAGLYRNLPGASQGSYGLSTNAGNAAVANTAQPGAQLLSGMAQGAGFQQTGQGQNITGLGGVLNAQNSYNNMVSQANTAAAGQSGQLLGTAIGAGAAIY